MFKDLVVKALTEFKEAEQSRLELVTRAQTDRDTLVKELLLTLEPEEIGGRTALAGFYYQFLVTIEYMIEVMEGKWDFVSLELHEDIIVGKGKQVRFVQVKTSCDTDMRVSETGIYSRTFKNVGGVEHRRPDSWVDKLLMKARHFPVAQGFNTQFELVTSFVVVPSRDANVSNHCKNYTFDNSIPEDDDLLTRLSGEIFDKDTDKNIEYLTICGEDLRSLLSRFNIRKKTDLLDIRQYIGYLLNRLSEKMEPGIRVEVEDLQWIIGVLMEKCQSIGNNVVLYMDSYEVEEIRQLLHDSAIRKGGKSVRKHNSIEVINEVFDQLLHDIQQINLFTELEREVNAYKVYMIEWVDAGGTIRDLMNRYLDGKKISNKYREVTVHDQTTKLLELFNCALLLIIINEELFQISAKHSSLLVKEVRSQYFSFLSLNRGDTLDTAIEKIRQLLLEPKMCIDILLHPPTSVLLQGRFTGYKDDVQSIIIFEERPNLPELPENDSLVDMRFILDFIPGGQLYEQYDSLFQFQTMTELRTHLKEFWKQFKGE